MENVKVNFMPFCFDTGPVFRLVQCSQAQPGFWHVLKSADKCPSCACLESEEDTETNSPAAHLIPEQMLC